MSKGQKQLDAWSGTFGEKYVERNSITPEVIEKRRYAFSHIFEHIEDGDAPGSILEAGCNIGINIHALSHLTDAALHVVEPNQTALKVLLESGVVPACRAHLGSLQALPLEDSEIDLVFTSGVLIHIPDDALETALSEIHRVSRKFILALEYFSPDPHTVRYHGHTDFLFKRDYGGLFLDTFSDIEHVANGFFWRRTTGLDNLNWWLLRKRD